MTSVGRLAPHSTALPRADVRSYAVGMPRTSDPRGWVYRPLAAYLAAQSADEVTLSFAQIRAILGRPLPSSAYLRTWWTTRSANTVRSQRWRAAGWEATLTQRADEWRVTFRRRL